MPVTFSDNFESAISPLRDLLPQIRNLLPRMVPERSGDSDQLGEKLAWHLILDETSGEFRFNANATHDGQHVITVSLAALERIWAFVYSFLFLFDESNANPGVEITLNRNQQTHDAFVLLDWAMYGQVKGKRMPWDSDLPRPDDPNLDPDRLRKTNHHFLGVLAFMMLHEIAHLEKGHAAEKNPPPGQEHQDELTADQYAAEWLLRGLGAGNQRIDRCNWIALAFSVLNLIEFTKRRGIDETHPPTIERLARLAADFIVEERAAGVSEANFPLYVADHIIAFQNENLITGVAMEPMTTLLDRLTDLLRDFETAYRYNVNLRIYETTRAHDFRRTQGDGSSVSQQPS